MRPRFFKAHSLPLPVYLKDPYAQGDAPATNLGIDQAMEVAWDRTPTGRIDATAATAYLEVRDQGKTLVATATAAFTSFGYRWDAIAFGDYFIRARCQTSEGNGEFGDYVLIYSAE
jgi:hypothetical protein